MIEYCIIIMTHHPEDFTTEARSSLPAGVQSMAAVSPEESGKSFLARLSLGRIDASADIARVALFSCPQLLTI
ncbi:MAG: hypothetical protein NVS4B7_00470 [Ktedonobacteraceae bacterium]